jgi:hypothetical protein
LDFVVGMDYAGRYKTFDPRVIETYPLRERPNKVTLDHLVLPSQLGELNLSVAKDVRTAVKTVADAVLAAHQDHKPVIVFTGAHLIKNGLGPLLADLVDRRVVTLVAGTGATAIHDFELALIGRTSEDVPAALGQGWFGMAYEFAYINTALSIGNQQRLGLGESLGRFICEESFREQVLSLAAKEGSPRAFEHPQVSVLAACYRTGVPFTVHAGIGTDVSDQHPTFDGQAKGGCSGRDFLIYVQEVTRLTGGGVVLNIGSAVTGPEVLLKAVSMAANAGSVPNGFLAADFDIREHRPEQMSNESAPGYYFRDQKSIVTRIPKAFHGTGLYVQGDEKTTFPLLHKDIVDRL